MKHLTLPAALAQNQSGSVGFDVSIVVPNLWHNSHNSSVAVADQWLSQNIRPFAEWAMANNGLLIITFDEVVREHYRTKSPRQIFSKVKFLSGAHSMTSAIVAFELAVKANPSAICCLTDGYIDLPETPAKNTTFVIPEGGKKQPWGKHYIMEHPWR